MAGATPTPEPVTTSATARSSASPGAIRAAAASIHTRYQSSSISIAHSRRVMELYALAVLVEKALHETRPHQAALTTGLPAEQRIVGELTHPFVSQHSPGTPKTYLLIEHLMR